MSGVSKLTADRHQRILLDLVSKPGNDVCADCKARAPRWASHNLGIFICMNCASIHRKIGTHITKVKSLTMDAWSREQVEVMKSIGNIASNATYNPNETRHPPPANREESERDSELEKFIRWKYEFKRFMEKPAAPSSSLKVPSTRAHSTPATSTARRPSPTPPAPAAYIPTQPTSSNTSVYRPVSASATVAPSSSRPQPPAASAPVSIQSVAPAAAQPPSAPAHPVWNDIMSLAGPPASSTSQFLQPSFTSPLASGNPYATLSPSNSFPSTLVDRSPSRGATISTTASAPSPFQPQPSMINPFGVPQQAAGFPNQMTGAPFQQMPMQNQSQFSQSPFTQASQPFSQPAQASFSHSYTPPSSFPQQSQQQQQQYAQSLPQTQMQQQPGYQQQQPTQGGNPFGAPVQWPQQTGFPGQQQQHTTFPGQQTGFPGQQTGFTGQQHYGQWGNM